MSPIARFASQFIGQYPDRVLYGTDMHYCRAMFRATFRILETLDEHFYEWDPELQSTTGAFAYHWPLYGLGLQDDVLEKVYGANARKVFRTARHNLA